MISAGLHADHGQWACKDLLTRTGRGGQKYSEKEVRNEKYSEKKWEIKIILRKK